MKIRHIISATLLAALISCTQDKLSFVDPFIGTDFTGHTFPAASCPLGMVQPGPHTGNYIWKYCSGYNYSDSLILGFTQNRLNGTGCPSYGNILIMPSSVRKDTCWSSRKSQEIASPGFYSVKLPDNQVDVDITCTQRVSCYTFDYKGDGRYLMLDFQNIQICSWDKRLDLRGRILDWEGEFSDPYTMRGHLKAKSWVEYDLWYNIVFDTKITSVKSLYLDPEYVGPAYVLCFGEGKKPVKAKIAISYTGAEGAAKNMEEVPEWNFRKVRRDAEKKWSDILELIDIDAPDSVKTAFYTSMYHMYLQPGLTSDKDAPKRYSTFSQWDTFRAADPLRTMLTPDLEAEIVNCMIDEAAQRGHLPVWDLCGKDNYCMIGNHAVPTVVDACLKKLPGVNPERAWAAVKLSLTTNHKNSDWDIYDKYGYYPYDLISRESVSRTLECSYDDWCAAQLAKELGRTEDYDFFLNRSRNYLNLFDPQTGFFRAKDSEGKWREPFEPYVYSHGSNHGNDFTEGSALHYRWHILQEPDKLIELLGGNEMFVERLDSLFELTLSEEVTGSLSDITGQIGQYTHGNEPCHHVIYLYTLAGRQDKAAEKIREVFAKFYKNEPGGLCGNDDCGQMSAWYIYSALGKYPVNPVSGDLVPAEPQVRKAVIRNSRGEQILDF